MNVLIPRVKYLQPIFESEESKKTHVFNAFCDPQLFPPRALVNASKHRLVTGVFGCACIDSCVVSTLFSLLACERVRAHLPELEYEDIRRLHAAVSAFSA